MKIKAIIDHHTNVIAGLLAEGGTYVKEGGFNYEAIEKFRIKLEELEMSRLDFSGVPKTRGRGLLCPYPGAQDPWVLDAFAPYAERAPRFTSKVLSNYIKIIS